MAIKRKVKKSVSAKRVPKVAPVKKSISIGKIVLWILGVLVAVALLAVIYNSVTGNAVVPVTGYDLKDTVNSGWDDYLKPVLEYLVGQKVNESSIATTQDFFSMALLILVIVFSIVFVVVKKMPFFNDPSHNWLVWVISIAVSLLAVRFLTNDWLVTILLPYSTLGVAISAGLPFVLYFFLVSSLPHQKDKASLVQKIAWVFFGVIFLYLWYDRSRTSNAIALAKGAYYSIYGWTALIALAMALFGQKLANKGNAALKGEKESNSRKKKALVRKAEDLHEKQQHYKHRMDGAVVGSPEYNEAFTKHQKVTEELSKIYAEIDALGGI
jgi:hypothetical protein